MIRAAVEDEMKPSYIIMTLAITICFLFEIIAKISYSTLPKPYTCKLFFFWEVGLLALMFVVIIVFYYINSVTHKFSQNVMSGNSGS